MALFYFSVYCACLIVFIKQIRVMNGYSAVLFWENGFRCVHMKGMLKCLTKKIFRVSGACFSVLVFLNARMCMRMPCGLGMLLFYRLFRPLCSFIQFLLSMMMCVCEISEICFVRRVWMVFWSEAVAGVDRRLGL